MSFEIDQYAHVNSVFQRWDPRFKIAAVTVFIFSVALATSLVLVLGGLLIALASFAFSRLPWHMLGVGVKWLAIFFVPFFIFLPLSFPSEQPVYVFGVGVAMEGVRFAILITAKAFTILFLSMAVFGSARFHHSMHALEKLRCPTLLVNLLLFCYRYIFVLIEEMRRMYRAMLSRGFKPRFDKRTLITLGYFVGNLLLRSFERTERIYKAMLSKGFTGRMHYLTEFHSAPHDFLKAGIYAGIAVALTLLDRLGPFHHAVQGWY